jgi:hypothetical protein
MCLGSTSSFISTFLLALASFITIWNFSKIKEYVKNEYLRFSNKAKS